MTNDKPTKIIVDICIDEYPENWKMCMYEMWCIAKLKESGIPISGTLCFNGVKEGVLKSFDVFDNPNIKRFVWSKNYNRKDFML